METFGDVPVDIEALIAKMKLEEPLPGHQCTKSAVSTGRI